MTAQEKYDQAFVEVFDIEKSELNEQLEYQSIATWDSVGHMALIAALEDAFEIMLEMDDIVDFGSYMTGRETLKKYGVAL
jgi:acyl carrier protein